MLEHRACRPLSRNCWPSVSYLVDEVDESSGRPFVADALSMVQHARTTWRAAVVSVVSRSSAAGAGRPGSVRTASWSLLGEHRSRGPSQAPGGTGRPNRLVESRGEPLVPTW